MSRSNIDSRCDQRFPQPGSDIVRGGWKAINENSALGFLQGVSHPILLISPDFSEERLENNLTAAENWVSKLQYELKRIPRELNEEEQIQALQYLQDLLKINSIRPIHPGLWPLAIRDKAILFPRAAKNIDTHFHTLNTRAWNLLECLAEILRECNFDALLLATYYELTQPTTASSLLLIFSMLETQENVPERLLLRVRQKTDEFLDPQALNERITHDIGLTRTLRKIFVQEQRLVRREYAPFRRQ